MTFTSASRLKANVSNVQRTEAKRDEEGGLDCHVTPHVSLNRHINYLRLIIISIAEAISHLLKTISSSAYVKRRLLLTSYRPYGILSIKLKFFLVVTLL